MMKKIKDEKCQTGGCSANYIWLGLLGFLFIIFIAMIFGR